ncbi:MAG: Uma2 family endonuclease [Anaerolineaceae bacterium]|nr:MAG: Uma2 family endonuclease [Anaerolineaceae bacterium]
MAQMRVQIITAGEFNDIAQAAASEGRLLELVHGEVVEKMPTETHGKLAALIAYFLLAFIRPRGIRAHVGVEVRHEAPDDAYNSRLPDVSLRFSDAPPVSDGAVSQMPDLAVEIQSPTDRPHQMREKALYYLSKGAHMVWLVYPAARQVEICTLDADDKLVIQTVTPGGTLTAGDVLPEFELVVDELFSEL